MERNAAESRKEVQEISRCTERAVRGAKQPQGAGCRNDQSAPGSGWYPGKVPVGEDWLGRATRHSGASHRRGLGQPTTVHIPRPTLVQPVCVVRVLSTRGPRRYWRLPLLKFFANILVSRYNANAPQCRSGQGWLTGRATEAGKLASFYGYGAFTTEIRERKNRYFAKN